jgi:hypothetical protein
MKYKGIVGQWKKKEVNMPGCKMLTVITDSKETTEAVAIIFLPEHKITDELRATAQLISCSLDILTALTSLVELKQWKTIHGKDSTYAMNRDMTWLKAEQALENALKFKI